jgi:hypothetical protein
MISCMQTVQPKIELLIESEGSGKGKVGAANAMRPSTISQFFFIFLARES